MSIFSLVISWQILASFPFEHQISKMMSSSSDELTISNVFSSVLAHYHGNIFKFLSNVFLFLQIVRTMHMRNFHMIESQMIKPAVLAGHCKFPIERRDAHGTFAGVGSSSALLEPNHPGIVRQTNA